ncbi:condensation domain-containing protein [Actinomadura viridis]|uniref:condensation domain-containing protein n=1 Tax=Actinomadura viridis TaxID=58110 RepID=UPI0036D1B3BF
MTTGTSQRLPLTESQKSLLVIHELAPIKHLYTTVTEIELDPSYTDDDVRSALTAVVTAQPALRLVVVDEPTPHAVLTEPPTVETLPFDSGPSREYAALEPVPGQLSTPSFDFDRGPLYRFSLVRSETRAVLVAAVHHIAFDGLSAQPMIEDLAAALRGTDVAARRTAREKALARELAAQDRIARDPATAALAREWASEVREPPDATLYPHPDRPADTGFRGEHIRWRLSGDAAAAVTPLCRRIGISSFEFFTAVYATTLARHMAVSSVVLGTPLMSRRTAGAFELCGFFVNTLPLIVNVDWSAPFEEVVRSAVRPAVKKTRARADIGLNRIAEHLRRGRSANRNPVFSCVIAMQVEHPERIDSPVRAVRERPTDTAKFDCGLSVTPVAGEWLLDLEYDRDLLPRPVADGLARSLRTALDRALSIPDRPTADLFVDAPDGRDGPGGDAPEPVVDVTGHVAPVGVPGRLQGSDQCSVTIGSDARSDHLSADEAVLRDEHGTLIRLGPPAPAGDAEIHSGPADGEALGPSAADPAVAAEVPDRGASSPPSEPSYRDDLEREVAELWMELLDVPTIDPSRSLLAYGAHSLMVFTALSRVRRRYQVAVPVIAFFRKPTVAALAETIRRGRSS